MARIIATANESTLKANLESRIKTRLGEVSTTRDSTTNILSSSIGDELVSLRR